MTTRRAFLETTAAILVSPRGLRSAARLPIGFSTLGCPAWTWKQILDFAQAHDYAAQLDRGIVVRLGEVENLLPGPGRTAEGREADGEAGPPPPAPAPPGRGGTPHAPPSPTPEGERG